ncbi:MAG TPA: cyclic nucleotide-binding domain-containing protein [Actinomycetota bacterium]|nr:cyclic nucleotide-binding domain-containing protein [Actinomycetota bacterium]
MDAHRLRDVPLFRELSNHELERIAGWADEVEVPEGAHLLDEGRFPHEFFVILDGNVDVMHEDTPVASLGRGDFLGEIAIIEGLRRTATVVAVSSVRAAVMHERDFREMCDELPVVEQRIRAAIRDRLSQTDR